MSTLLRTQLLARLLSALRPGTKVSTRETAQEMGVVRREAVKYGIDFDALLLDACKQLKAEKKNRA